MVVHSANMHPDIDSVLAEIEPERAVLKKFITDILSFTENDNELFNTVYGDLGNYAKAFSRLRHFNDDLCNETPTIHLSNADQCAFLVAHLRHMVDSFPFSIERHRDTLKKADIDSDVALKALQTCLSKLKHAQEMYGEPRLAIQMRAALEPLMWEHGTVNNALADAQRAISEDSTIEQNEEVFHYLFATPITELQDFILHKSIVQPGLAHGTKQAIAQCAATIYENGIKSGSIIEGQRNHVRSLLSVLKQASDICDQLMQTRETARRA